jgi:glyceraldehyde-3-phosphate dehydrogenase/erythrose-4-phosphate dehydrogenase
MRLGPVDQVQPALAPGFPDPVADHQHRHAGPDALSWGDLGVDLVLECTGVFTTEEDLAAARCYQRILGVSEDQLVSADTIGDPRAAVVDLELTRVVDGTLVKVMAWDDNEWGLAHQMIREARSILGVPGG